MPSSARGPARGCEARGCVVIVDRVRAAFRVLCAAGALLCVDVRMALAHPKVDEAGKRLEAAEFDSAGRLLAEAEAGSDLTRDDALRLLELRALLQLALKQRDDAMAALQQLAVLSPEHQFPRHTSPDLLKAFAAARATAPAPPSLTVERELASDGVRLHARVGGDTLGLLRGVRLWTRIGSRPWRSALASDMLVPAAPGEQVTYRAEALGFGGAPLYATDAARFSLPNAEPRSSDDRTGTSPWLYGGVIGGALAVAGAVIVVALLSSSDSDSTQVSPPTVVTR